MVDKVSDDKPESGLDKIMKKQAKEGAKKKAKKLETKVEDTKVTVDSKVVVVDNDQENSDKKVDKSGDQSLTDAEKDQALRMGDPFERMVANFKTFSREHSYAKHLNLTFEEQRRGVVLVYQGQKSVTWVWLKNTGCKFVRKSLLRSIQHLDDDHYLQQYFKQYSMITGEYDASL